MFDVTNLPFRMLCRYFGASATVTEFVSINQLIHVYSNELQEKNPVKFMILTAEEEKPVGLQVFGYSQEDFRRLSEVFSPTNAGFDFFELNIGCPVTNICKTGSGSRLLAKDKFSTLEGILRTIIRNYPDIPVSLKMRAGYKEKINIEKYADLINSLDLLMVTIHPKLAVVVKKGSDNPTDHGFTSAIAEALDHPVIVNGGIESLSYARELQRETKTQGSMIGRAAMRWPFIFSDSFQESIPVRQYLSGIEKLLNYYNTYEMTDKHGFPKLYVIRDQIVNLVRGFRGSKLKRQQLHTRIDTVQQITDFVHSLADYFLINDISIINH